MSDDFRKAAEARARSRTPSPVRHPLGSTKISKSPLRDIRGAASSYKGNILKSSVTTSCMNNHVSRHYNYNTGNENAHPNVTNDNNNNHENNSDHTSTPKPIANTIGVSTLISTANAVAGMIPHDCVNINNTPNYNGPNTQPAFKDAELAARDFIINGDRACSTHIRPRWVLDEESTECTRCQITFDLLNRRHHCRHCGLIFCAACTATKCLLPPEFGFAAPEKVCNTCAAYLQESQGQLVAGALHAQHNPVELAPSSYQRYMNLPCGFSLTKEVQKATYSVYNLFHRRNMLHDADLAAKLLRNARGLVFLTSLKAGLMFYGGQIGSGILIRRTQQRQEEARNERNAGSSSSSQQWAHEWSAPCAVQVVGLSCGIMAGCEVCDYVIFLNSDAAVEIFAHSSSQFSLGAGLDVTIGLLGRAGGFEICVNTTSTGPDLRRGLLENAVSVGSSLHTASVASYGHSRGFYIGASVDSLWFSTRPDINLQFYGRPVAVIDILAMPTGSSYGGSEFSVMPPLAAYPLYEALYKVTREFIDGGIDIGTIGKLNRGHLISSRRPVPTLQLTSGGHISSSSAASNIYNKSARRKTKKFRRVSILI